MELKDEQVDEYCGLSWAQDIIEAIERLDRQLHENLFSF